ncbi:MAG: hypothetical protein ACOCV1_03125 [Bacillota bacterium]
MIDYDNSSFEEVWDYEFEEGLEERKTRIAIESHTTGKFYDDKYGIIYYMKNSLYHREDGPAYIHKKNTYFKSHFIWYNHGKQHRMEGPALYVFNDNKKNHSRQQFWIFGKMIYKSDFLDLNNLANRNKVILL